MGRRRSEIACTCFTNVDLEMIDSVSKILETSEDIQSFFESSLTDDEKLVMNA